MDQDWQGQLLLVLCNVIPGMQEHSSGLYPYFERIKVLILGKRSSLQIQRKGQGCLLLVLWLSSEQLH